MQDVKSKMRLFLSVLVVFGILSCEALAVPQESVSTANKAGSLTYVSANDSFTVAYNNAEVLDSEEYVLFAFKGTSESFINPLSNPTSILYVNQYSGTQVKSGVSILLMNTESCAVWLCGRYSSGAKQVLIGTATVASGGPTITTQPTNVTVAVGGKVTLSIAATGTGLKYQWQASKDGTNWSNSGATGCNTATMTFNAGAAHNGYKFHCVVTDANGKTVTSNAATVTVGAANGPTITTQPTNVTVAAGSAATFKVVATGAASYQWQASTNGGSTWADSGAAGNKTATLSFTAATAHNGYKLRCIVTGTNGQKVISNAATVTVY